jgi:hypothetical protein
MKRILLAGITMLSSLLTFAQTDTSGTGSKEDTVRVGNFIIIKNKKEGNTYNDSLPPDRDHYTIITIPHIHHYEQHDNGSKNLSTNWLIFDLGFLNYNDRTDYSDPATAVFAEPGITKHDMKLITGKSSNVNIWVFMQKLNLSKHVLNLKYGIGFCMYNYRYSSNITFQDNSPFVKMDTLDFSKNKLYAAYATVPLMLNITPHPGNSHGFNFSLGLSAGYRMNTHTKQISDEFGKVKNHNDFDIDPWLVSYTGEVGMGPLRIYGSYSINTLFQNAQHYPYTIGLRFSNW